jgi:predicted metal-binding membrane protein
MVAAAAWVGVVAVSRGMGDMPGTMGLSLGAFLAVWALMMTAMMLPTIAPFAALWTRTFTDRRARRIAELAAGYLLVWIAAGLPAYGLAWLAEDLVSRRPTVATALAVVIFAMAGFYQLTPIKDRCLARCRSPLGFLFTYYNYRGRLRDLRVGLSHGSFCLACCWALMVVLVAVGLMNLPAMVILAAVVLLEKTARWGPRLTRAIGVVALVLAVAVAFHPALATGLAPSMGGSDSDMSHPPMAS